MVTVDDLIGITFNGFFQRDPRLAAISHDWRKTFGIPARQSTADERQEFSVKFLIYNPENGLIIGYGHDIAGESGLVGEIDRDQIKFYKAYAGKRSPLPAGNDRIHFIIYEGKIDQINGIISLQGTYKPLSRPFEELSIYQGTWQLQAERK